jgi:hypothetical protein
MNYSTSWSAVRELIDVPPSTASGRPGLITLEASGGMWGLYYYAPAATGVGFASSATLLSGTSDSPAWKWSKVPTLVYAGSLPGDATPDLLIRGDDGSLDRFTNIEAGINADPSTVLTVVSAAGAFTADAYPFLVGAQSTYWGKPSLWTVNAAGVLSAVPVNAGASGGVPTLGTSVAVSATGWGHNILALENAYVPFDNVANHNNGSHFTATAAFNDVDGGYSVQSLETAFTAGPVVTGLYTDNTGATAATGLYPDTVIATTHTNSDGTQDTFLFAWPGPGTGCANNFQAAGQTIPFPIDYAGTPATKIALLGASTGPAQGSAAVATLTWSDGTQEKVTLTFSDWLLGGSTPQTINAANDLVGTATTEVHSDGTTSTPTNGVNLFEDVISVTAPSAGAQLASITLPTSTTLADGTGVGGQLHIFALGSDPAPKK